MYNLKEICSVLNIFDYNCSDFMLWVPCFICEKRPADKERQDDDSTMQLF